MAFKDIAETVERGASRHRDRLIAVYIGALAVALAICSVGAGNAEKEAMARNIEAANTWAFFQAKNVRRNDIRLRIDALELRLESEPEMPAQVRTAIDKKLKSYRASEAHLSSEPGTGEGLEELTSKGKSLEAKRDIAMRKDPYFDYGQALLQIAIVLASVSIITGGTTLLVMSGMLGIVGVASMLNGFTLAYAVPFIA